MVHTIRVKPENLERAVTHLITCGAKIVTVVQPDGSRRTMVNRETLVRLRAAMAAAKP